MSVYCPIAISSLQNFADMKGNDGANLFLSKEFLDSCKLPCSGSNASTESRPKVFPVKYLNIMNPFKDDNNLGRSVSKGLVKNEKFFKYTINRNGRGTRLDVQVPIPAFGTGKYEALSLLGYYSTFYNYFHYSQWGQECSSLPDEHLLPLSTRVLNLRQLGVFNQSASPRKGTEVFLPEPHYFYQNLLAPFRKARGSSGRNLFMNRSQRRASGRLRSRQPGSFGPIYWEQGDEANDLDEAAKTFAGEASKHLDTSADEFPFVEQTVEADGETSCRIDDSLEEFPLLSGSVRYTESKVQSNPSRGKPQQSSKTITFGSF